MRGAMPKVPYISISDIVLELHDDGGWNFHEMSEYFDNRFPPAYYDNVYRKAKTKDRFAVWEACQKLASKLQKQEEVEARKQERLQKQLRKQERKERPLLRDRKRVEKAQRNFAAWEACQRHADQLRDIMCLMKRR
jgi:predicted ribosome quality control (RQC) complex YloA/Tae2 family protein